jgi:hypothetical protein
VRKIGVAYRWCKEAVGSDSMNHTPHKSECPGLAGHIAEQSSNTLNFATDTRTSKSEAELIFDLKKSGHSVHALKDGGYIISQWGFSNHAKDIKALQAFAVRVGVCHA